MNRRELPLTALRSFEMVGRFLSFGKAAEYLGVTQGAVSRQVTKLEEFLDSRLFHRGTKLTFTPAGEQLYNGIRPALDAVSDVLEDVRNKKDHEVLRINAPPTFTMKWLIPRMSGLQRLLGDTEVRLSTAIAMPSLKDKGTHDVVIRRVTEGQFGAIPFLSSELIPVCAPELLERSDVTRPADLVEYQLLEASTSAITWQDWFALAGLSLQQKRKVTPFEEMFLALQAALDGVGVALLPSALVVDDLAAGRLISPCQIPGAYELDYCYIVSSPAKNKALLALFLDWLDSEGRASAHLLKCL